MGKTLVVRLAVAAAGGTLALAAASSAALAQTTVDLNPAHKGITAGEFENQECDGPFEDLGENQEGWHFVLTSFTGSAEDVEFVLQFEDAEGNPVEFTENATNVTGSVAHLFLVTEAGLTLVDGDAVVSPPGSVGNNAQFNLSHTCPGVPGSPSPSPSPSESPSPSPGESPSVSPSSSTPGNGGGGLPTTGVQAGGLAMLGAVMLAGGAGMVLAVRRRRGDLTEPADG
jgi:LPXTG-motif cell wall-anchored protein